MANGHVIDPDGEARRVLHEAVVQHGPQALSDAVIMEGICRARLAGLPGETALIVSAARTDVPALLRDLIPELGNYGAIQSAATTLAGAHRLNTAACVWVVREFARALGLIAAGRSGTAAGPGGPAGSRGGPDSGAGSGRGPDSGAGSERGPDSGAVRTAGVPGDAGSTPPGRPPSGSRLLSRSTVGVAAAVAVVAAYLGVAAVAHLSPFPAERGAIASSLPASPPASPPASQPASANPSPSQSPDPSPTSVYQILLSKIPSAVQGQGTCRDAGTYLGAAVVSECARLQGMAAGTIYYYLFSGRTALHNAFGTFLQAEKFKDESPCTNSSNRFARFIAQCESGFTNATPDISGDVAEYANPKNQPIIVSTDEQQLVMAIMVGTNGGDLLSYWKQMRWVAS